MQDLGKMLSKMDKIIPTSWIHFVKLNVYQSPAFTDLIRSRFRFSMCFPALKKSLKEIFEGVINTSEVMQLFIKDCFLVNAVCSSLGGIKFIVKGA